MEIESDEATRKGGKGEEGRPKVCWMRLVNLTASREEPPIWRKDASSCERRTMGERGRGGGMGD